MSATQLEQAGPAAGRPAAAALPSLITRPLLVRFVSVIGAEMSFFLPLSVVPLYVKSSSGSGAGAGLATAVLLAAGGAACFGTGFGILQNATLAMMYARADRGAYDAVSAIWNAAWDAGMGAGAGVIGLLAATAGYPAAFVITAAQVLPALVPVLRERSRPAHAAAPGPRGTQTHTIDTRREQHR